MSALNTFGSELAALHYIFSNGYVLRNGHAFYNSCVRRIALLHRHSGKYIVEEIK